MYATLLSIPVAYRLPDDPTLGTPPASAGIYYSYFTTSPRIYGEEFVQVHSLFVEPAVMADSSVTIVLGAAMKNVYGFADLSFRFNGATGAFLGYGPEVHDSLYEISQSLDGSLWAIYNDNSLKELDPRTYAVTQTIACAFFDIPTDASDHFLAHPMVDRANDRFVHTLASESNNRVVINRFSTGELIRVIYGPAAIRQIVQESDRRCFLIGSDGSIAVLDYTTGDILSVTRGPSAAQQYAWDFTRRRLLAFNQRTNATNGASNATIEAYFPVPLAVGLTKPIPLKPPRNGRTVPLLCRAIGDAGEPIPSVRVTATATSAGTIVPSAQITDSLGYATINLNGTGAGSSTVDLSADV